MNSKIHWVRSATFIPSVAAASSLSHEDKEMPGWPDEMSWILQPATVMTTPLTLFRDSVSLAQSGSVCSSMFST
eukprot:13270164-Alexandrium_andersonii.AAC.1